MPSFEHNGVVEMFRENPTLAPHLLQLLFHIDVPAHASVSVVEASLDQLIPIEFRADLVLELKDAQGQVVLSVVFETQLEIDHDKEYSWAVYVAVERSKKRCPAILLAVAPDPTVAAWASRKLDLGLGLGSIQPLVIGPAVLPQVTDPELAQEEIELTVLSAMVHGNGPNGLAVLEAASHGLMRMESPELAGVYFQLIHGMLREPLRKALEAMVMQMVDTTKTFPPFIQQFIDKGEAKGEAKGKLEGRLEGEAKGKLEGKLEDKHETLLRLLARKGIAVPADDRARVMACTDGATLDRWIDNVLVATTIAEVLS